MGFSKPAGDNLRTHGAQKKPEKIGTRAYNSYFEGYTEYITTDSRGRQKKRYVYTDPYYRQDLTKRQWISVKLGHSAAFLLACALFAYGAIQPYVSVVLWYAQGLAFFSLAWLLYILAACYLPAGANLTAYMYKKSAAPLRRVALGAAILQWLLAGILLLCLIMSSDPFAIQGILTMLAYAAAGVVLLLMYLREKRIKYIRTENRNIAPEHGYKIINDRERPSRRSDAVGTGTVE